MKKLFFFFLFSFFCFYTYAEIKIKGRIKNANNLTTVQIFYEHDLFEIKSFDAALDVNGNFEFTTDKVRGNVVKFSVYNYVFDCFVKSDKVVEFESDFDNFPNTLTFKNDLSKENNYLALELKYNIEKELNSYNSFSDAKSFKNHVDSIMSLNFSLWKNYNKVELDNDFLNYVNTSVKYKHVNGLWMYKIGYDPSTNKYVSREIPNNYFEFLDTLKFDAVSDAENSHFSAALLRYLFEKYDKNSLMNLPVEYSDLQKSKYSFLSKYNYRKAILKGDVLEFELVSLLRSGMKYVKPDLRLFYDSLVSDFNSIAKNKEYVAWINKYLEKTYSENSSLKFPEINLVDANGHKVNLTDFKGKVVYVDLWGTWCVPCLVNMNESKKLSKKFSSNDVVFLYVNMKDTETRWKDYLKKNKMDGVHVFADKANSDILYKELMISGVPRYMIINRDGKTMNAFALPPALVEEMLTQAINK